MLEVYAHEFEKARNSEALRLQLPEVFRTQI
jgi:hypothetical protein